MYEVRLLAPGGMPPGTERDFEVDNLEEWLADVLDCILAVRNTYSALNPKTRQVIGKVEDMYPAVAIQVVIVDEKDVHL